MSVMLGDKQAGPKTIKVTLQNGEELSSLDIITKEYKLEEKLCG